MLSKLNCQVVSPDQYPSLSTKMFAIGNVDLLSEDFVLGITGARKITPDSIIWLKKAIDELKSDWVIASGLALGTDAVAHNYALQKGIKQIAVLPTGFNRITPKRNIPLAKDIVKNNGLLLSKYPVNHGLSSNKQYIERNKIIVDLSISILSPQFESKSGTRHTINFAQKQGKLIILPDADYSGNQEIIHNKDYRTFIK